MIFELPNKHNHVCCFVHHSGFTGLETLYSPRSKFNEAKGNQPRPTEPESIFCLFRCDNFPNSSVLKWKWWVCHPGVHLICQMKKWGCSLGGQEQVQCPITAVNRGLHCHRTHNSPSTVIYNIFHKSPYSFWYSSVSPQGLFSLSLSKGRSNDASHFWLVSRISLKGKLYERVILFFRSVHPEHFAFLMIMLKNLIKRQSVHAKMSVCVEYRWW